MPSEQVFLPGIGDGIYKHWGSLPPWVSTVEAAYIRRSQDERDKANPEPIRQR